MKHKSASIGFSYLAGLICAYFLPLVFDFALFGICAIAAIVLMVLKRRTIGLVLLILGIGAGVFGVYRTTVITPALSLSGQTFEIDGTVAAKGTAQNDNTSYTIDTVIKGGNVRLTMYGEDTAAEYGDKIHFTGTLSALNDSTVFAEKSYNYTRGIFLEADADSKIEITKSDGINPVAAIYKASDYMKTRLEIALPEREGAILKAIFFGDKSGLTYAERRDIKYAGISHLTAVSGMHLCLAVHIIMLIIGLTPLKYFRKTRFAILTLIILIFMVFFRLSFSVIRAGIMLIIYYGAELFLRKGCALNSVGFAAFAILIFSPTACVDIGFLLSITGTLGVGVVAPYIAKHIPFKNPIFSSALFTLCATLCTFPLAGLFFSGVSIVGIVVNILIVPFFTAAVFCVLLFTICGGFGNLLPFLAGIAAKPMLWLIDFFGGMKYAWFSLDYKVFLPWLALAVITTILIAAISRSAKKTAIAVASSFALLFAAIATERYIESDYAVIKVLSDGNDAAIIAAYKSSAVLMFSDDSIKLLNQAEDWLLGNNYSEAAVVAIIGSTNNALDYYKEIPSKLTLTPDMKGTAEADGFFRLISDSSQISLCVNDVSIILSSVKNTAEYSDISVRYGYKKEPVIAESENCVYSSKRLKDLGDNAYCSQIVFKVNNSIIRKEIANAY